MGVSIKITVGNITHEAAMLPVDMT